MEVDKRGTRKRRVSKFRGIPGKKGGDIRRRSKGALNFGVRSHRLRSTKRTLLANPLEGKSDRSPAQEGHRLMFFYASLRSVLWISRASLRLWSPLHVFPHAGPRRSFDAAVNVFWDPKRRTKDHKEIRLCYLCVSPVELYFLEKCRSKSNNALYALAATSLRCPIRISIHFFLTIFHR